MFKKDVQYIKFCSYGFLKNLRFFEPFFILYLIEAGISFLQIGLLFTIRAIAVNIIEIPSGVIADAIGRRKAMIISFISYIVSFLIFFFAPRYIFIIPAMILFAFGEAFRTGTHKAMILDYLKRKGWEKYKTYYYGNTRSWSQRGSAISALIAAGLVFYSGNYRSVFLFTLIPYVLELALMISYPSYLDGIKSSDDKNAKPQSPFNIVRDLLQGVRNPNLRIGFLNSSIPNGFFETVKDYIQPIIAAFSLTLPLFRTVGTEQRTALVSGITYSLIFLLTSIASKSAGSLSEKFHSEKRYLNLTYIAGMSLLISTGIIYRTGLPLLPIIIFMGCFFIHNLRRPVTIGYLSEHVEDGIMATALSVDSQLKTLWVAILSPVIGLVIDQFGLGAAIAVVGTIGLILYPFIRLRTVE